MSQRHHRLRQSQRPICRRRSLAMPAIAPPGGRPPPLVILVLQRGTLCHFPVTALRRVASRSNISRQRRVATPVTEPRDGRRRRSIIPALLLAPVPPATTAPQHVANRQPLFRRPQSCDTSLSHHGLDAGDDEPYRYRCWHLCRLAVTIRPLAVNRPRISDDAELRYLPSHDGLDAGDLQPYRCRRWHLCHPSTTARLLAANAGHAFRPHRVAIPVIHHQAWTPATFNESGVAAGTCATCHNGTTARGKPATRTSRRRRLRYLSPTTAGRRRPSATRAWSPERAPPATTERRRGANARRIFRRHKVATPATARRPDAGDVQSHRCRSGDLCDLPQRHQCDRQSAHFVTTRSCDACHRTTGWTPTTTYAHQYRLQGA